MQIIFSKGGLWETPWMERVFAVDSDLNGLETGTHDIHAIHYARNSGQEAGPMAKILSFTAGPKLRARIFHPNNLI